MVKRNYHLTWRKHVSTFMLATLTLSSCLFHPSAIPEAKAAEQTDSEKFEEFSQELFKEYLKSDYITYNFGIIDDSQYDLGDVPKTVGSYSEESLNNSVESNKKINKFLNTLNYNNLTKEEQDLYDLIRFETKYSLQDEKYQYYGKAFSAYNGLQTSLIMGLTAFRYDERSDFEDYIEVLKSVPKFIDEAIAYEQKRSEKGLFLSDQELDKVLNSIREIIKKPEENVLITSFNVTVDKFGLNNRDKVRFKKKNHDIVINEIIPAYKKAAEELEKLRGTGVKNDTGLSQLPEGRKYYEHLVHYYTGTERSPMEYVEIFDQLCESAVKEIQEIAAHATPANFVAPSRKYVQSTPEEYLSLLMENAERLYTPLEGVEFRVKYVDESLGEYVAPAYVYKPQIDAMKEFDVNINPAIKGSASYDTVAHEAYPGHLYQFVSLNLAKKNPLYHVYQNYGYVESWSQNAQNNAWYLTDCSDSYARYMKLCMDYAYFAQVKLDILIHYSGYSKKQAIQYLMNLGLDEASAEAYYYHLLSVPAYNLCYAGGYAELQLLIQHAQEELGEKFNQKEFNDFYVSQSCLTFKSIRKNLDAWIAAKR